MMKSASFMEAEISEIDEDSSDKGGTDSDTDYTDDENEFEKMRESCYHKVLEKVLSSAATNLYDMRYKKIRAANQYQNVPKCRVEKILGERDNQVKGFRLKPILDNTSQTSIKSSRFLTTSAGYPMNFIHDYVLSVIISESDKKLRDVFPVLGDGGDELSPDIAVKIHDELYVVIEFTTRGVSFPSVLGKAFTEKRMKYIQYLIARENKLNADTELGSKKITIKYCIIVVCPESVYTNIDMDQDLVDELCMRYRFASSLHPVLTSMKLVRETESDLDPESDKIKMNVGNFDFEKLISDEQLEISGFPEYTKKNYNEVVVSSLDEDKFKNDIELLFSESTKESLINAHAETPLDFATAWNKKVLQKREEYESKFNKYCQEQSENNKKISKKPLVLYPYLNMQPNPEDSISSYISLRDALSGELVNDGERKDNESDGETSSWQASLNSDNDRLEELDLMRKIWHSASADFVNKNFDDVSSFAENNPNQTCLLVECSQWDDIRGRFLEDIDEEDDGNEDGTKEQVEVDMHCHQLEAALYEGGVDKAYNDRSKYKRVEVSDLSAKEKILLAKRGVQAKKLKDDLEVQANKEDSRRSISMKSKTEDIDDFLEGWLDHSTIINDTKTTTLEGIFDLISKAFELQSGSNLGDSLINEVGNLARSRYGLTSLIWTHISFEINASIKQHCKRDVFLLKKVKEFPIYILIKPTNSQSHIFFSLCWRKSDELQMYDEEGDDETHRGFYGRIIDLGEDWRCTPFYSMNKSKLPNYCQSFPRLVTLFGHFLSEAKISPIGESNKSYSSKAFNQLPNDFDGEYQKEEKKRSNDPEILNSDRDLKSRRKLWRSMLLVHTIGLHNKAEVEEMFTIVRFIMMEAFVHRPAVPDPGKMVDNFKEVVRSRFTFWVIKKLDMLIRDIYEKQGYSIREKESIASRRLLRVRKDLYNFFTDCEMEDEGEAINSFYFGYAVDKNQIPESNSTAQLYEKILHFEDLFKAEDIGVIGIKEPEDVLNVPFHHYSVNLIKGICKAAKAQIEERSGIKAEDKLEKTFLIKYRSMTIFDTMSTLKASTSFSSENESPDSKFPRRGKLIELAKDKLYSGKVFMHEILLDSLIKLIREDSIFNDLFKKNQHGGLREIYVMNPDTRVVQHFIETMARACCSIFPSETMTNPRGKVEILDAHNEQIRKKFGKLPVRTFSTSDDARKWNQGHYVHKFYVMLCNLLPKTYHEVIRAICYLWQKKKILINEDLLKVFKNNPGMTFNSEVVEKMRRIYRGEMEPTLWMDNGARFIICRTGMEQGILHYTSSLFHTVANELVRKFVIDRVKNLIEKDPSRFIERMEVAVLPGGRLNPRYTEPVVSIMQSSDDSAMQITAPICPGSSEIVLSYITNAMFNFKHKLGAAIGIHLSVKSTQNTLNIMEFNSVWNFLGNRFQPHIKQVLASLTVSESGNLLARMQENYNAITTCLENGASFFTCAFAQIAQAVQHYFFMGATVNHNFLHYAVEMIKLTLPTLGFFLLDHPALVGIGGFECLHYNVAKNTDLKHYYKEVFDKCSKVKDMEEKTKVITEETVAPSLHNSLCQISHGQNHKLAKLKEKMELDDDWLDQLNENPLPLVRRPMDKHETMLKIAAKLHSPGLSNSFNSPGNFSNICAEGIYITSSKCLVVSSPSTINDMTQYKDQINDAVKNSEIIKANKEKFAIRKKLAEKIKTSGDTETAKEYEEMMEKLKISPIIEPRGPEKYSLLYLMDCIKKIHNRISQSLRDSSEIELINREQEALEYLKMVFARYDDYDEIGDNAKAIGQITVYRDDKNLKNRFLKLKVSSDTLEDSLKPYDIVIWKLFKVPSIQDTRAGEYGWTLLKRKYSWLSETWQETLLRSPFTDVIQLLNFLSRLDKSARTLKLQGINLFTTIPGEQLLNLVGCNMQKGFSTNLTDTSEAIENIKKERQIEKNRIKYNDKKISVRAGAHFLCMAKLFPAKSPVLFGTLEAISKNIELNETLMSKRMKEYNILFGFASGSYSAEKVIKMCQEKNVGLIGGYTYAQEYDIVSNQYHGYGTWEGLYEGVSIKIVIASKVLDEKIPMEKLRERLQKLKDKGIYENRNLKIKLDKKVVNFICRVVISKELPVKDLQMILSRWCETNKVNNSYSMTEDQMEYYKKIMGDVEGLPKSRNLVKMNWREAPTEKMIGYMINYVITPPSGKVIPGCRIHLDKDYRRFILSTNPNEITDMGIEVTDNGTFRINIECPRSEEERDRPKSFRSNNKVTGRPRSHYTILSVTPRQDVLMSKAALRNNSMVGLNLGLIEFWIKGNPLTSDDVHTLLSRLGNDDYRKELEREYDIKRLDNLLRRLTKFWLKSKKIIKDDVTISSDEEKLDRQRTELIREDTEEEDKEAYIHNFDNLFNSNALMLDERYKYFGEEQDESDLLKDDLDVMIKYWTEQDLQQNEDDVNSNDDYSSSRVGGRYVEEMRLEEFILQSPIIKAYLSSISDEDWSMIINTGYLPLGLQSKKENIEYLLSTDKDACVLKMPLLDAEQLADRRLFPSLPTRSNKNWSDT